MADEESAGGLEAVIKVTLDDSGLEGEAQAAVEKVQSVTKGKRATVQATVEIDGAQVAAEIEKKTRGKRSTVKVKPVVEDADIAALKQRFNLAQMALAGARQGVGDQSKPKDERALLHAAIPKLQALVDDIPKAIAKREGRPSAAPSAPVTTERVNEVARQVGAAMRGRPVERPAASTTPASSPVVVVRSSGGSTSAPVNTGRSVRARPVHGAGPGAIAQLIRQLSPTFAAFESGGSPEIEALDAYYQALDKERGKEQRARERATPSAALARATARVPMERTTRRRPLPPVREPDSIISGPTTPPFMEGNPVLGISPVYKEGEELRASSPGAAGRRRSRRDPSKETPNKGRIITRDAAPVLPGQVGTPEGEERYRRSRERAESAARRSEAPVSEDTFSPIGERFRQSAPRYSQSPIAAGEELGRPSARGKGGKRAGDQAPLPRGELGRIFRQFQAGQYEDFFQPWDETGKRALGPPERAAGSLAQRIKLDDPKYEQFRHEGRYLQRVSPKAIAASEREQYLAQLSEKSKIPQLGLIGLGPLGSARTSRRRIGFDQLVQEHPEYAEMPLAELKRQDRRLETEKEFKQRTRKAQRDRQQTASRTTEDVINFNMWLQESRSGEGQAGRTGHINVGGSVLPSIPTQLSPLTRMLRGTAPVKTTIQRPDNKERLDKAAGRRDVPVFDPTAPSGQAAKTVTDTGANVLDAALSRDVAEVVNPRMAGILEGLREGQTMTDVGRLGREGDAPVLASNTKRRGQKDTLKRTSETMLDSRRLSPGQTALHRFSQLIYDLTKSAGYSERSARKYQLDPKTVGSAKRLDPALRTYLSGARESIYGQMAAGRDAADALDPLQRDPMARGEKTRTWTPAYGELQELEGQLKGTPDHPGLNTRIGQLGATEFANDSGPTMSPEKRDAIIAEREALKKQRAKLYKRRIVLRKQDEEQLAAVAAQTGGTLQGERGGIRGYATRDRTQATVIAGQRLGGVDELVPARRPSSFGEGRADSGDVFAATAAGAASQAGTNLGPTEDRPAEEAIRRSKLKPRERFKLQDTTGKSAGAPPTIPVAAASAGGAGEAPPPRDIATAPSSGGGGSGGLRDGVRVIVTNWKQFDFGQGAAAKIAAKDPGAAHVRRITQEYERSVGGEPGTTPAALAERYLAAQEAKTPGMSPDAKQKFLRKMDFTERESREFSGLRDAERAAKGGRKAAPVPEAPPEAPGPRDFVLGAPSDDFTESRRERERRAKRLRRLHSQRLREDSAERLSEDTDPVRIQASIDKMRTKDPKATDLRMLKRLKEQGFETVASQEALGIAAPSDRKASIRSMLNRTEATSPGVRFLHNERDPSIPSDARIAAQAKILEARSANPTRAFTTAMGAWFAKTLGGGGEFEVRARKATRAWNISARADDSLEENRQDKVYNRYNRMQISHRERELQYKVAPGQEEWRASGMQGPLLPGKLTRKEKTELENLRVTEQSLAAERGRAEEATPGLERKAEVARERAEGASKKLTTPLGVARGFAMLGVGAIAGGMIFQTASQAVQAAIDLMETQAIRAADALGGFSLTAIKVSAELAGAVKSSFGNTAGAVAGAAAPSGISATALATLNAKGLSDRAEAIAAAQARVQESDLVRSSNYLGGSKLPGGYDRALFQGTGGILNTQLMAPQPGFMERIADDFQSFSAPKMNMEAFDKGGLPGGLRQLQPGARLPDGSKLFENPPQAVVDERTTSYAKDLNAALDRANSGFEVLTKETSGSSGALKKQQDAMMESAKKLGQTDIAQKLINAGVAVTGKGGRELTGTELGQAASDLAKGQLIVDQKVAFEQDKRGLQAQINQIGRETAWTVGTEIPRSAALQNLAAPQMDVVGGQVQATGIVPANAVEQTKLNDGIKKAQVSQTGLNSLWADGESTLKKQLNDVFHSDELFNSIKSTGVEIASIQADISKKQANLSTHEYANQLRIAERSLTDIAGLMGKNAAHGASTLGIIERENVMLSRQSELLGQMLQQRQINFQLAVAGFQVGGESGEERAARIKDAKTQAEFAQKQLDISKKTFGNNIKLFDLQNVRSMTDAIKSIGLLKEGRAVAFDTAVAEKNLSRLNKLQDAQVKKAGAGLTAVDKALQLEWAQLTKMEAAYGKAVQGLAEDTMHWFSTAMVSMTLDMRNMTTGSYAELGRAESGTGPPSHASGFLGNVSGATSMIMGEAGTETVAILRNPREATLSGGGGGGVTININHPVVRNDQDINKITASVVRAINTRTALLGLR